MGNLLYISNIAGRKASTNFFGSAMMAAKNNNLLFYAVANRSASSENQIKEDEEKLDIHLLHSDIARSPFSLRNIKAYKQIVEIIKENEIVYIHCNTPIGGVLGRFAGKRCKVKKIIYQAHGFHFYDGAPLFNRTVIKWAEQIMAHWTNAIITINEEDYQSALKFKLRKGGKVYKVHGVGINLADFNDIQVDKFAKRTELGLKDSDVVCISAGDLITRKNYSIAIEALAKTGNENLHYLICGVGPEKDNLQKLAAEKGVTDRIHFLGFRTDVKELMKISDIFLFTTFQEGLPRSMMEAMACGLPCVASKIRGNVDLLDTGKGGYLKGVSDLDGFTDSLKRLANDGNLRGQMGAYNLEAIKSYDMLVVAKEIETIYNEIMTHY